MAYHKVLTILLALMSVNGVYAKECPTFSKEVLIAPTPETLSLEGEFSIREIINAGALKYKMTVSIEDEQEIKATLDKRINVKIIDSNLEEFVSSIQGLTGRYVTVVGQQISIKKSKQLIFSSALTEDAVGFLKQNGAYNIKRYSTMTTMDVDYPNDVSLTTKEKLLCDILLSKTNYFEVKPGQTLKEVLELWAKQNENDVWQIHWSDNVSDLRLEIGVSFNKSFLKSVESLFEILPKDAQVKAEASINNRAIKVLREGR